MDKTQKKEPEAIKILGHSVFLEDIENPHIQRAIRSRLDGFFFNYGDDHSDRGGHNDYDAYGDHSEYSESSDHTDHYPESRTNRDCGISKHSDYNDYDDHSDYHDMNF